MKYAVSAIIFNDERNVLFARRAPTKFPPPNVWSLPSSYVKNDDPEQSIIDAAKRKLGIDIVVEATLGTMQGQQADYQLHMTDYIVRITAGTPTPDQQNFSKVAYFNPLEKFAGNNWSKMGFCVQTLLRELEKNPLLRLRY